MVPPLWHCSAWIQDVKQHQGGTLFTWGIRISLTLGYIDEVNDRMNYKSESMVQSAMMAAEVISAEFDKFESITLPRYFQRRRNRAYTFSTDDEYESTKDWELAYELYKLDDDNNEVDTTDLKYMKNLKKSSPDKVLPPYRIGAKPLDSGVTCSKLIAPQVFIMVDEVDTEFSERPNTSGRSRTRVARPAVQVNFNLEVMFVQIRQPAVDKEYMASYISNTPPA